MIIVTLTLSLLVQRNKFKIRKKFKDQLVSLNQNYQGWGEKKRRRDYPAGVFLIDTSPSQIRYNGDAFAPYLTYQVYQTWTKS